MFKLRPRTLRLVCNGVLVLSILFVPVWVSLVGAALLTFRWRAWEVVAYGVFVDLLYLPVGGLLHIPGIATIVMLGLLWGLEPLRRSWLR